MNDNRFEDFDDFDDGSNPFGDSGAGSAIGGNDANEAAIAQFTQMVDEKLKILMNPKRYSPKERREAAHWLGYSGETRAISSLVKVYRSDKKNKDVQQAAAYALGRFKALDEAIERGTNEPVMDAIERPENAHIGELLMSIALSGGGTGRPRIPARVLYILMALLTVTLAVMLVLMFATQPNNSANRRYADQFATLSGAPEQVAVQQARILTDDLKADVQVLNRQTTAAALDCTLAFNEPISFVPTQPAVDALPTLDDVAARYNQARTEFFAAKTDYDSACSSGTTLPTATRGTLTEKIAALNQTLVTLEADVTALESAAQQFTADSESRATATAQALLTATAQASITPTLTPTLTVTPGIPLDQINRQIGLLASTIGDTRGGIDLLDQYWTNSGQTGTTQDCISAPPIFPENYVLPEDMVPFVPELKTVVDLLNAGLELSRGSYNTFKQGCAAFNLVGVQALGQETIKTARLSLDQAQIELDAYTAKIRQQP
jgi:hypothetical protein